jgi:uncharacterized membrane protein
MGAMMAKSAAFGVLHLGIAFGVSYTLSGSLTVAGAIAFIEPMMNVFAHYFFERWWDRSRQRTARCAVAA